MNQLVSRTTLSFAGLVLVLLFTPMIGQGQKANTEEAILGHTNAGTSVHDEVLEFLNERRFISALAKINSLIDQKDPQLVYWKGVCLAATDQHSEAIHCFEDVRKNWPESEFCDDAITMTSCLEHLDSTSEQFVDAFDTAIKEFKSNHEIIQLKIESKDVVGIGSMNVQFGIDFNMQHCQLLITQNEKTAFEFESTDSGSRWYITDMGEVKAFKQPLFPVMNFEMVKLDDDSFKFNLSGSISSSPKASKSTLKKMLESEWLSTRDGIRQLIVTRGLESGCFPFSVETIDGKTICKWIQPDYSATGFKESGFEFLNGRLSSINYQDFHVTLAPVSETGVAMLNQLEWPEVDTVESEFDVEFIKDFVDAVGKLSKASESHESVAEDVQEKTIR